MKKKSAVHAQAHPEHTKLSQWFATAICGNDILSSTFYVSGISIIYAGVYAPIVLACISLVLFFYKSVYTEVVSALPVNGGAYNCLLNATSKQLAAIAGTTTILSYIATAVISGESAMQYLNSLVTIPVIPLTIGLLGLFAVLVISGIKDSAKVAFAIFSFHVLVLSGFVAFGAYYALSGGHSYLWANLTATTPILDRLGGLIPAIFFGFAASLLGVSGFESSANFVEEQKPGVFPKTLRNMLISVAIFNPSIALIALNTLPFDVIIKAKDFLLSDVAHVLGGPILQYIVVIDAVFVLSGAVLTAFVGVSGLIFRMTTDGCFPDIIAKVNKKGSYPYIIILFFALCTSILLATNGDLLSLAGVYTIAFLSVMTLFALGNLLMRETRKELKRPYHAPLIFVIFAFIATAVGIFGNVRLDPVNVRYFLTYFAPAILLVFGTIYLDYVLRALMRFTRRIPVLHDFFERMFDKSASGTYIVFVHHLDRLYDILNYIDRNEVGRNVYFVHCNDKGTPEYDKDYKELVKTIPILQKSGVCPQLNIQTVYRHEKFGPEVVDSVAHDYKIPKNKVLLGSIRDEHTFSYEEFDGARIIF